MISRQWTPDLPAEFFQRVFAHWTLIFAPEPFPELCMGKSTVKTAKRYSPNDPLGNLSVPYQVSFGRRFPGLRRRLWPRPRHLGHLNGRNSRQNGHEKTAGVAKATLAWPKRRWRGQSDAGVAKATLAWPNQSDAGVAKATLAWPRRGRSVWGRQPVTISATPTTAPRTTTEYRRTTGCNSRAIDAPTIPPR